MDLLDVSFRVISPVPSKKVYIRSILVTESKVARTHLEAIS